MTYTCVEALLTGFTLTEPDTYIPVTSSPSQEDGGSKTVIIVVVVVVVFLIVAICVVAVVLYVSVENLFHQLDSICMLFNSEVDILF